jgi:hypothetical protein
MARKFFTLVFFVGILFNAQAKIWRINNNPGITADFSSFNGAATSATVVAGDTLYLEASPINYGTGSFTLGKRLVVIGLGYFLDPTNTTTPANTGLQAATANARLEFFRIGDGSNGSKFIGVHFTSGPYLSASANPYNLVFEKCYGVSFFPYFEANATYNNITIRKCFFQNTGISAAAGATVTNFTCENNVFWGSNINLPNLSGTNNIIRNNSFTSSGASIISNAYVANNIFGTPSESTFTNCTIKNNLFQVAQTLPPTATNNQVSVNMTNVYVGGSTGSLDSRIALKPGSPAIGAGLTIGAVVSPDCGAYGATDPYKLSGIPNIPSIYSLTVPTSIPAGTPTMNVTFSTRSNN